MSRRNVIQQIQRECRSESIRHRNLQLPQVGQRRAGQVRFIAYTSLSHLKRLINQPSICKKQSGPANIYKVTWNELIILIQHRVFLGGNWHDHGMIKDTFIIKKIGTTIVSELSLCCLCVFCIFRKRFFFHSKPTNYRTLKLYTAFIFQFVKNSSKIVI